MSDIEIFQNNNQIFSFNGVDVKPVFLNGNVWLSRSDLQLLFKKSEFSIRRALKEVEKVLQDRFSTNSLLCNEMAQNSASGQMKIERYNLEIITRVGMRLNGRIAEAFQDWVSSLVKREIAEQADPSLTLALL
jgi:prophage antirepressor-like protein